MTASATLNSALSHPRISARRAAVEDQKLRSRNRRLIGAGVVILAALIAVLATQSPLLDVDEVRVIGAVRQNPELVRELSGVHAGEPLVGLDLEAAEEQLASLPEVAWVQVSKNWAGVVTIEVIERAPVARFVSDDEAIVAAGDGVVLDVPGPSAETLPLISGAMFVAHPGESVPAEVTEALAVAAALPPDIAHLTEKVEIAVDMLALRLVGGGKIELGDDRNLDSKFDAIRAFFAQVELDCLDTLNVQAPTVPVISRQASCR